ncbi:MAG: 30S ribosomal protein S8 [Candidatus Woesearchaeota archaeon]
MTLNDPLANVLSHINNAEHEGKQSVTTRSTGKLIKQVLALLQEHGYLGSHEETAVPGGKTITINLLGGVNQCGVIKPRYSVKSDEFVKFEKRYLPAKGFGIILVSTSKGLLTHEKAKEQNLGGRLIAYCY